MKRTITLSLIFLFLGLNSCKKEHLWLTDYPRSYIEFYVTDQDGNNLLDPAFSGNILNQDITMEYNNTIYPRIDNDIEFYPIEEEPTKASYHPFNGLMTNTVNNTLKIGYFNQSTDYEQASFTIDWGNGSKDVITFDQKSVPYDPDDGDLYANCQYWLNGRSVSQFKRFEEGPHFTIVLNTRYGRN